MNTSSSLFLRALNGQNHAENGLWRPPVWLMRQAGRYMPEYRALRKKASFLQMCEHPELICEVTLQPIQYLNVDAAILFSDILIVAKCFGLELTFEEGRGPVFARPISSVQDLISRPCSETLSFVGEGIRLLKKELQVPLIGFCGAPFTVASYFIEGQSSQTLFKTRTWAFEDRQSFLQVIDKLTAISIDYLKLQVEAGVDAVQVFDTWASFLPPDLFEACCFNPLKKITSEIEKLGVPVILFGKGGEQSALRLSACGSTGVSADWSASLPLLREKIGKKKVLQGNLDPAILLASPKIIEKELNTLLDAMQDDPAYIFNLGHGITKETPPEHVAFLVKCLQARSPTEYCQGMKPCGSLS